MRHRGASLFVVAVLAVSGCTGGPVASPESASQADTTRSGRPISPPPATTTPTPTPAPATPTPTGPSGIPGTPRTMASGLAAPWGLAFLPDGRAVVSLRDSGRLVIGGNGVVQSVQATGPDGVVPGVRHGGEGGLLGVALEPNYTDGGNLFLYRSTDEGNQVIRATLSGDRLGEPAVILSGIPAASNHNGGQLAFGPDGYLYVTTGDANRPANAQDPSSLGGKILRIQADGTPAPNPSGTHVWSLGHRNVQGIGWDASGRMWASEFGQSTWDELNLIEAGGNYGWPAVEGRGSTAGMTDPVAVWPTDQASPSGLAVAPDAVYLAALRGQRLWRVPTGGADGAPVGTPSAHFTGEFGRLRAVQVGPDGALWVLTNNTDSRGQPRSGDDRMLRIPLVG